MAAARVIRVSEIPFAIFARVFEEHGAIMVFSIPNEPLATLCAKSSSFKIFAFLKFNSVIFWRVM